MMNVACHYTEDDVLAFVAGDLPDAELMAMALHFGECDACREQATEFTALHRTLESYTVQDVVRWDTLDTPFGSTYAAVTGAGLARVSWHESNRDAFLKGLESSFAGRPVVHDSRGVAEAGRQLDEYFGGRRTRFELPVDLSLVSDFDRRVLDVVREIPSGRVLTYADVARRIGSPSAARAVGNYERKLQQLARVPVLIIDDFGLKPLRTPADEDLHDLIAERYEQAATVVTSNLDFSE